MDINYEFKTFLKEINFLFNFEFILLNNSISI